MNPNSIRGSFKPNQSYVCLPCLLNRPFARSRQTLRFVSTIYPTPDPSVAALLWSQQKALAKAATPSEVTKRKPEERGQIEQGKVVESKYARAARPKAKSDGQRKISKATGDKRTRGKDMVPAEKDATISALPESSTVRRRAPTSENPTSSAQRLQEEFKRGKKGSVHTSTVLSDMDGRELESATSPNAIATSRRKRVQKYIGERTDRPYRPSSVAAHEVKSKQSAVKAAKRLRKTDDAKVEKLADRMEGESVKTAGAEGAADQASSANMPSIRMVRAKHPAKSTDATAFIVAKNKRIEGARARSQKASVDTGSEIEAKELHAPPSVRHKTRRILKKRTASKPLKFSEVKGAPKIRRTVSKHVRFSQMKGAKSEIRRTVSKPVRLSQTKGAKSIKEALTQESSDDIKGLVGTDIQVVNAAELDIAPIEVPQRPVPGLSYGLERVLFNPGVYYLQEPRSRVFNFDPYLQSIMPVSEFDFNALKEYITSSRDESLKQLAQSHGKRYVGSSSSMTAALAHFHFLLSQWREIDASMLSRSFPDKLRSFTKLQRSPSAIFLKWRNGSYAIDADKEFDTANVLMMLGKSMEKLLTLSTEDYERYRVSNSDQISSEERNTPESYHYSTMGDFLMRSQLDAYDARLPGTGMFDLKTRAVISIRMDAKNYEDGVGYQIKGRHGNFESFEREYFDMIRAAFLKYSLQVRMGRMDGIFVAFHNTERIFGFQYISLPEMDATLHGQFDTCIGDQEFKLSLDLLNKVLDKATKRYPEQSLRIHFETRDTQTPFMYVFAEPVTEEQVRELQTKNQEKIAEFERNILGLHKESADEGGASKDDIKWADIRAGVEDAMAKDEESLDSSRKGPLLAASENSSDREEDNIILEQFETVDRDPLYGNKGPLGRDDTAAAATADELEVEDDDDDDNTLDEEAEENAEDEGEEDAEVEDVAEEDDADVEEEDDVIGEEAEDIEENGGEDELDEEALSTTGAESSNLGSAAEAGYSTEATENSGSMAEEVDAPNANDNAADFHPPLHEMAAEGSQTPGDSQFLNEIGSEQEEAGPGEILALTLSIRNKMNDQYVLRPVNLTPKDKWSVEYSIAEIAPQTRAWSLYQACQLRRKKRLDDSIEEEDENVDYYLARIQELSRKGRKWRKEQDELDEGKPKLVLGQSSAKEKMKEEASE